MDPEGSVEEKNMLLVPMLMAAGGGGGGLVVFAVIGRPWPGGRDAPRSSPLNPRQSPLHQSYQS